MKPISEYLIESIYGNLGLSDALYQNWVDAYNNQINGVLKLICNNGKIQTEHKNAVHVLQINNDTILNNGILPALPFDIDTNDDFMVCVKTKLKSFANLPHISRMRLHVYTPVDCLDTIDNCKYLKLEIPNNVAINISNVKPIIYRLDFIATLMKPTVNAIRTLNNIKGCNFGMSDTASFNRSTYIDVSSISQLLKDTKPLSLFFSKNKFNSSIILRADALPDLNFLDDIPCDITELDCVPPKQLDWADLNSDDIKDFLAPVQRNINKFKHGEGKICLNLKTGEYDADKLENYLNNTYNKVKFEVQ